MVLTDAPRDKSKQVEPHSTTHEFQLFCRKALYDCITSEKTEMLQPHIYFYTLVLGVSTGMLESMNLQLPEIAGGIHFESPI